MFFGYFTLLVALIIETVGAYYSISGLAAIFSGAVIPILVMGASLEVGKVTAAVWLKLNWDKANLTYKLYLVPAVALLMFLTSMGIFGFLSKAHSDQTLVSGYVQSKLAIYDEKIKTAKENIEADRKQLKQMDEAVDQVMARSTSEQGADKSNAIRRSQQRDRAQLAKSIEANQRLIASLNDEAAPIRAEIRKVEAEVGPIKYIAAFIYGNNPDANLLERAVTWVIIVIVAVFDPLALVLILAAQQSIRWARDEKNKSPVPEEESHGTMDDDIPATSTNLDGPTSGHNDDKQPTPVVPLQEESDPTIQCYKCGTTLVDAPGIGLFCPNKECDVVDRTDPDAEEIKIVYPDHEVVTIDEELRRAKKEWKTANPDNTIHRQERLLEQGKISKLPWEAALLAQADDVNEDFNSVDFGTQFPHNPVKGDAYIRVDYLPTKLFKFNGNKWIEVDKNTTDTFAYNDNYIDHLIAKIGTGEYDPDLLNPSERDQIESRLRGNDKSET